MLERELRKNEDKQYTRRLLAICWGRQQYAATPQEKQASDKDLISKLLNSRIVLWPDRGELYPK